LEKKWAQDPNGGKKKKGEKGGQLLTTSQEKKKNPKRILNPQKEWWGKPQMQNSTAQCRGGRRGEKREKGEKFNRHSQTGLAHPIMGKRKDNLKKERESQIHTINRAGKGKK